MRRRRRLIVPSQIQPAMYSPFTVKPPYQAAYTGNNFGATSGNSINNYQYGNVLGRRRSMIPRGPAGVDSQFARALVDPFSSEADGVKVPDSNQQDSVAFRLVQDIAITTDLASGTTAFVVNPYPGSLVLQALTVLSPTAWTFPAASYAPTQPAAAALQIGLNFNAIRPVAWGLRGDCQQSLNNAQGTIHTCLFAADFSYAGPQGSFPTTISGMKAMPTYQRWPIQALVNNEMLVVGYPTDESAYRYRTAIAGGTMPEGNFVSPTGSVDQLCGWYLMCVAISGNLNTANPINFEVVVHYEGIQNDKGVTGNSANYQQGSKAAPYVPIHIATAMNLSNGVPAGRCVDTGGVAEMNFGKNFASWWNTALQVSQGAVDAYAAYNTIGSFFL